MYYIYDLLDQNVKCLASFVDEKWMWHKKLGHAHMRLIMRFLKKSLLRAYPRLALIMTQLVCSTKGVNKPKVPSTIRM